MEAIKVEELHTLIGKVNSTSWFKVDQDRINAFADVTGYQKFCGWYANANADGPFIYTGFKPAFFLMFNINNSG